MNGGRGKHSMFWAIQKVQYNWSTGNMSGTIRKKTQEVETSLKYLPQQAGGHHPQIVSHETGLC